LHNLAVVHPLVLFLGVPVLVCLLALPFTSIASAILAGRVGDEFGPKRFVVFVGYNLLMLLILFVISVAILYQALREAYHLLPISDLFTPTNWL